MITAASQLYHLATIVTGLPPHLARQLPNLVKRRIFGAVSCSMESFLAERTGLRAALWTDCAICTRLDVVGDNKGVTVVVAAVRLVICRIFHDRQFEGGQFFWIHVTGD